MYCLRLSVLLALLTARSVLGQTAEQDWTERIARQKGWSFEVRTESGTYCDLMSDCHAFEVEWPRGLKPYEAVGQSLHYAIELDRVPAICFLLSGQSESQKDYALKRVGSVAKRYGIRIYWYDIETERLSRWNER